jgi:hypothetical protein
MALKDLSRPRLWVGRDEAPTDQVNGAVIAGVLELELGPFADTRIDARLDRAERAGSDDRLYSRYSLGAELRRTRLFVYAQGRTRDVGCAPPSPRARIQRLARLCRDGQLHAVQVLAWASIMF